MGLKCIYCLAPRYLRLMVTLYRFSAWSETDSGSQLLQRNKKKFISVTILLLIELINKVKFAHL